jgi:glutamine cyclotransferase
LEVNAELDPIDLIPNKRNSAHHRLPSGTIADLATMEMTPSHLCVALPEFNKILFLNQTTMSIEHELHIDGQPAFLVFDGTHLWVSCTESNKVHCINLINYTIDYTRIMGQGTHLLYYVIGYLWICSQGSSKVTVLDCSDFSLKAEYDVHSPRCVKQVGLGIWIAGYGKIYKVNLADPTNIVDVIIRSCGQIIDIEGCHSKIWVVDSYGMIFKLNASGQVVEGNLRINHARALIRHSGSLFILGPSSPYIYELSNADVTIDAVHNAEIFSIFCCLKGDILWINNWAYGKITKYDLANKSINQQSYIAGGDSGIATDGKYLWIGNSYLNTITKYDTETTEIVESLEFDFSPTSLLYDGSYLWALSCQNDDMYSLYRIDPNTNDIISFRTREVDPIAICSSGSHIWCASKARKSISAIDIDTGLIESKLLLPDEPYDILFDGESIWVSCFQAGKLLRVHPTKGTITEVLSVTDNIMNLAFSGNNIWFTSKVSDTYYLNVFHPFYNQMTQIYELNGRPSDILFDGIYMWTAIADNNCLQRNDAKITSYSQMLKVGVGKSPGKLTFDGRNIWATNQNSQYVSRLSTIPLEGIPAWPI